MSEARSPLAYSIERTEAAAPPAVLPYGARPAGGGFIQGSWVSRLVWAVLFAMPFSVIATAATLTPNPAGHGTHMQLGLPPCGFLVLTGYPCPGCGLTTAFASMVRGDVVQAAHANPFGVPLFLVSAAFIPLAALGFVKRWSVIDVLDHLYVERVAILLALCSVTVWVVRMLVLWH